MAKSQKKKPAGKAVPPAGLAKRPEVLPAPAKTTLRVSLVASVYKEKGLAFAATAAAVTVVDGESHQTALELLRIGKREAREAAALWKGPKQYVDGVKKQLLDLERPELKTYADAIAALESSATAYEDRERARVAAENERLRRELEESQRKTREAEAAAAEADAARLEAESPELSAREAKFVELVVSMRGTSIDSDSTPEYAANAAGYKDGKVTGPRLMASSKIQAAIEAATAVKAIREQSAAKQAAPLAVTAKTVEADLGYVAGTSSRTRYSCEPVDGPLFDLQLFRAAVLAGTIDIEAMKPNQTYLNDMADRLKENFEQAFPGCKLKRSRGIAG